MAGVHPGLPGIGKSGHDGGRPRLEPVTCSGAAKAKRRRHQLLPPVLRFVIPRPSAADGDYRKVGNGTMTRALRFVSILKSHHSSNRSHQGHGKRRKASGRSCLSAFATACTTAERTSAGICATAASSRYAEASARCLSARSRRSGVRRTTLNESLMARQTVQRPVRNGVTGTTRMPASLLKM
jgi:hypothetical protein